MEKLIDVEIVRYKYVTQDEMASHIQAMNLIGFEISYVSVATLIVEYKKTL
jgi:hypothetical protein